MVIKSAEFDRSCRSVSQFPDFPFPEFAFMGRSNVGKSSLINMVLGKKGLVKTGASPGVTRAVNFFIINKNISIADLPGYGYAKLPREISKTFAPLIRGYIENRGNLRLAFLLVDIRRIPDEKEREMLALLSDKGITVAVLATKCDKVSRNKMVVHLRQICGALGISESSILPTSARSGEGKKDMLRLIQGYRSK